MSNITTQKTIEQHKTELRTLKRFFKDVTYQQVLEQTTERIKLLESLYIGGASTGFSDRFRDEAYRERNDLCLLTSACYALIREQ